MLLGALGAVALLGFLSLAVILAQVVALVLLGFAPVALVIGIFPGAGHEFFRGWLTKLATAVFIKALYSLVIAIVVAVSAALVAATGSLGWLFAFGLQTIFFWAIFLYRKQITARLVSATTGAAYHERLPRMTVVQRGANIAARPFTALVGVGRRGSQDGGGGQESALAGGPDAAGSNGSGPYEAAPGQTVPATAAASRNGHSPVPSVVNGNGVPRRLTSGSPLDAEGAPPAQGVGPSGSTPSAAGDPPSAANQPSAAGDPPPAANQPSPDQPAAPRPPAEPAAPLDRPAAAAQVERPLAPVAEATPRASHEDVMRRARELRELQRTAAPAGEERGD